MRRSLRREIRLPRIYALTSSLVLAVLCTAARASAPPAPRRLFAGKLPDRSATVALSDAAGRPRLTLTVDAAGNPRIEFLDDQGKVVSRLPEE